MIVIRAKTIHEHHTLDIVWDEVESMLHYEHQFTQMEAGVPATRVNFKSGAYKVVFSLQGKLPDSVTIFNATK